MLLHFLMVILLYRLNGSKMDCLCYRECLYRIEFGLLANLLLCTDKSEKGGMNQTKQPVGYLKILF